MTPADGVNLIQIIFNIAESGARVESKFPQVDNDVYTITIPLAAGSGEAYRAG
jgi:hypothetical protein